MLAWTDFPKAAAATLEQRDEQRVHALERLFERARAHLPRDPFPHFLAHVRWHSAARTTDVLFVHGAPGDRSVERDLVIAHWQTSRFAEVLFGADEGAAYELATAQGRVTGQVLEANLIGFRNGELAHVIAPDHRLTLRDDGIWERWERALPLLLARAPEAQERAPSLIDVSLDPAQRGVVELPEQTSVLILGEAGHGKTTVALHRLARLERAAQGTFRAAVIVPTEGLRRLLQPLLRSLGVDVDVEVYDQWASRQAREVFRDVPERESVDASAGVIRFKRDPALRAALSALTQSRRTRVSPRRPLRPLKAFARRKDLLHLFGDKKLVMQAMKSSAQSFGAHVLGEIVEHARVQFSRTSEEEFAHVTDKRRLRAIDGRPIDEGTPLQDAGSIDAEDYAVLFELDRLEAARQGQEPMSPPAYDCILIDEAQELAPLELALIGRSLAPGGTLIVAGDADQQTDPTVAFTSWDASMRELGCDEFQRVVLPVSYRCPPEVAAIARQLRADAAASIGHTPFVHTLNECHLASWLTRELRALVRTDPGASVAVICRSPATARRLHTALHHSNLGRLVLGGDFLFHSGINVTDLDQVKGLEFDYVIVPDASASIYPATPEARRALYVAVTRARHQLVLGAVAQQTPLLGLPSVVP